MRPAAVVEIDPLGRQFSHLVQTFKDIHIEDRLSICSVKALDVAVLHRASGFDERELDLVLLGPVRDGYRSELRPVVESDPLRQASRFGEPVEHSDDPSASEIEIDLDRQYLASEVVDHVEGAKPASVTQCIAHEIGRPALVHTANSNPNNFESAGSPIYILSIFRRRRTARRSSGFTLRKEHSMPNTLISTSSSTKATTSPVPK